MSMILSAVMKLDAGGFTTPLGKATQGIQTAIRLAGDLAGKLVGAFDMGSEVSDLAAQTGELPSTLAVLQQAFADTGVGSEKTGQILAIMRRNMAQLNDDGSTTIKTFERLGISTDALKNMSATEQLEVIGDKIRNLATPADKSAAAMEIFGRSGAKMLTFMEADGALDTAAASLGGLPGLLDDNANAFDGVSDAIKRVKTKSAGLWAGIAEGALPAATSITDSLDGIDLTGLGQKIGAFMGTTVELFRTAPLGDLLRDGITIGMGEALNGIASLFAWLSKEFWTALSTPLSYLSAAFGTVIQGMMELIGKIPAVGKMLGLDGFEADTFEQMQESAKGQLLDFSDMDTTVELIDVSAEKKRMGVLWDGAAGAYADKLAAIQDAANAAAAGGGGTGTFDLGLGDDDPATPAARSGGGFGIDTDALARIGGFVGGGGGNKLEGLAERQLGVANRQLDALVGIRAKPSGGAVWARA